MNCQRCAENNRVKPVENHACDSDPYRRTDCVDPECPWRLCGDCAEALYSDEDGEGAIGPQERWEMAHREREELRR